MAIHAAAIIPYPNIRIASPFPGPAMSGSAVPAIGFPAAA
jgi:hypothetical protein